jgi:REP element-mobilizing transposase RayT
MALFQEAIIKKHLLNLDEEVIDSAYREYKRVYSTEKIKNIRVAKEEQYQEGFIKEIFGSVLGYSVYPESPYNIETEKKNETNSRKADGAILKDDKVVGVIELKDNKTKNLDAVKDQAFGYKNNHKDCSYVISSNFHKLRFYIDDATDYEEFDLYNLDKETFKRFYLYLRKEGLLDKNIPKLLRQETKFHEEEISKNLYRDYSNFKRSFFENALKNNPQFDKLTLFKKSQKFLDRVLFVLFAEDKGLVNTNSVVQIVEKWQALRDDAFDTPRPLYTLVLLFFNNLYLGKKDNKGTVLIPEFGGELFAPDEVLDQLTIDDDVLKDDLLKLSKYDFNTDVDVNILGHIFEHSLNEVDDVEAELRGEQLDKTKSKRKKDGVFYTPKYITKYIVDNTLGKLCSEKKSELKLDQDIAIFDFQKTDGKLNEKGKDLFERLNTYKDWLLTLKVCDPACGSGAFLNQALSFFIEEHKFVDDLIAELTNSPLRLFDTDLQILENNIYGVDINEESVEIAKLSLWLRTALPGRKLSNLSNNIKCGNSLIDDPKVAGDKAFNWGREFPSVFIEKNKFAYHITTSLHDSRTSPRMLEFMVRERRFGGSKPNAEVNPLSKEEEELIATTVAEIAKEDDLNIAAFNLCWDHMHVLLVCEEGEISSIMQKIKAKTARAVNILRGITKVVEHGQTSPNKGACSLDEIEMETSRNKGACSLDETEMETSRNKGAGSLDDTENTGSLDDRSAIHRIDTPRGEKQNSLWTQKFGCKPIVSDEQFWNTVHYIENNKEKHNLPRNPKLETIISRFVKTYEDCLKTEYTGGFDVVIGNPPYGAELNENEKKYVQTNYPHSTLGKIDSYRIFIEHSTKICKKHGLVSYIIPNTFMYNVQSFKLRKFLLDNCTITDAVELRKNIFEDAPDVVTVIFSFGNYSSVDYCFRGRVAFHDKKYSDVNSSSWAIDQILNSKNLKSDKDQKINLRANVNFDSINEKLSKLDLLDNNFNLRQGTKPYGTKSNKNIELISKTKYDNNWEEAINGRNIARYHLNFEGDYVKRSNDLHSLIDKKIILDPKIYFQRMRKISMFPRIVASFDESGIHGLYTCSVIWAKKNGKYDLKFLLGLLNSLLINVWYKFYDTDIEIKLTSVKQIPLPKVNTEEQNPLILKVNQILDFKIEFENLIKKFSKYFTSHFQIESLPGKLSTWYELKFNDFIKELNKAIKAVKGIQLTKKDEFEWMELFEENKKKVLELKSQIDQTDAAIDRMVYELYGLTEEEIQIVENS